ncbi:flavin reductase family protein [Microbacterium sp. NPDC096154]|uniref:flavin reductase family protein n=1 Tax=Microbacterium sp. NPDC096154 TaxID=3155549 RepID=UPI0033238656
MSEAKVEHVGEDRHAGEVITTPGTLDAEGFKALFRGHPGGVAVITAEGPDGPVALTATSVASVSVEPPMLIFSVSTLSSAAPAILSADTIVVHLLDAADLPLAKLASTSGVDRFANTSTWTRLTTGEPLFPGVRAWTRCAIVSRLEAGGSTVIVAHALQGETNRGPEGDEPLVYHNRTWHKLGEPSRIS